MAYFDRFGKGVGSKQFTKELKEAAETISTYGYEIQEAIRMTKQSPHISDSEESTHEVTHFDKSKDLERINVLCCWVSKELARISRELATNKPDKEVLRNLMDSSTYFYEQLKTEESKRNQILRMIQNSQDILKMLTNDDLCRIQDREEVTSEGGIEKRQHPRVDTFLKMDFKYHPGHNGVISGMTNVMNISEGGILVKQILATDEKTGKIVAPNEMMDNELYNMKFKLEDVLELIESKGECVREIKTKETLSIGICFKNMEKDKRETIHNYIFNTSHRQ